MTPRFAGPEVTLEAVLAAREARVLRRDAALAAGARTVVTLTAVMPGPVKDCPLSRDVVAAALDALDARCRRDGWRAVVAARVDAATGPEALVTVDADARAVKAATVAVEDGHRLGRLFDLDVAGRVGAARDGGGVPTTSLARRDLGLPPRRCLVCGEPAHACARSRAHPLAALFAAIEEMVDAGDA
jgi:holo-ACP synthase